MLTNNELQGLHRTLGHLPADKLMKLLQRAKDPPLDQKHEKCMEKIEKSCKSFQFYDQKPRRRKLNIQKERSFNHSFHAGVFQTDGKIELHEVDEATNFQAAK